jgi:hypothetical protein
MLCVIDTLAGRCNNLLHRVYWRVQADRFHPGAIPTTNNVICYHHLCQVYLENAPFHTTKPGRNRSRVIVLMQKHETRKSITAKKEFIKSLELGIDSSLSKH